MKVSSVSLSDYSIRNARKNIRMNSQSNVMFNGSHTCRNTGWGIGALVSAVGAGLWVAATGGIPIVIGGLMAAGTSAAGIFGDALDKTVEEDENKK